MHARTEILASYGARPFADAAMPHVMSAPAGQLGAGRRRVFDLPEQVAAVEVGGLPLVGA